MWNCRKIGNLKKKKSEIWKNWKFRKIKNWDKSEIWKN